MESAGGGRNPWKTGTPLSPGGAKDLGVELSTASRGELRTMLCGAFYAPPSFFLRPAGARIYVGATCPRVAFRPLGSGRRSTRGYTPSPLRGERSVETGVELGMDVLAG